MKNNFFGSKLNTVLLIILIILIIIALVVMKNNKKDYLSSLISKQSTTEIKSEILGNKEDLVSFSIKPGQVISGKMEVTGVIKGAYFFEGNLPIVILDANKEPTAYGPGHANSTTDWMTAGPVSFSFEVDFGPMPKGLSYIKIQQDDPRGEEERGDYKVKEILIPIIIK